MSSNLESVLPSAANGHIGSSHPAPADGNRMDLDHISDSNAHAGPSSSPDGIVVEKTKLILPDWDVPPLKPLHASHDFISLLHLAPHYNSYVRPYADPAFDDQDPSAAAGGGEDDEEGMNGVQLTPKKRGKRKRLEKGYWPVLLEDIIDPVPMGENKKDHRSLLPLIPDFGGRGGAGSYLNGSVEVWEGDIALIGDKELEMAKLEIGHKQDGYASGEKLGVKEAAERRQRRKARHSLSLKGNLPPGELENALDGLTYPESASPLPSIAPPSRPALHIRGQSGSFNNTPSRPTFGGVPISGGSGGGSTLPRRPTFHTPTSSGGSGPFNPNFQRNKRPLDNPSANGQTPKRPKGNSGPGSRSASPMIPPGSTPAIQRSNLPKHSIRARTEG